VSNPNILAIIAAAFYVAAAILLLLSLTRADAESTPKLGRRAQWIAAAALIVHTAVALTQTGLPGTLQLPLFVSLNVAAAFVVGLLLMLCLRQSADYLGLAVYPLAAILVLMSTSNPQAGTSLGLDIQLHVLLSLTAYAFLSLAAAQAVLVWIQRRQLQAHRPGGFMRALPALDTTESLLFTLLSAGFIVLSLSLATGFFYLDDMFAQSLVHKTVLSVLAWVIFGSLLFARWRWGWRGQRAVVWTLAGFAVLITAYFGSKFVLELLLNRS